MKRPALRRRGLNDLDLRRRRLRLGRRRRLLPQLVDRAANVALLRLQLLCDGRIVHCGHAEALGQLQADQCDLWVFARGRRGRRSRCSRNGRRGRRGWRYRRGLRGLRGGSRRVHSRGGGGGR